MGADDFRVSVIGRTAEEAFRNAVEEARHRHGHRRYTGTIAEKNNFIMIDVPVGKDPRAFANELLNDENHSNIYSKYGPAGCVLVGQVEHKRSEVFGTKVRVERLSSGKGNRKWKTIYSVHLWKGFGHPPHERVAIMDTMDQAIKRGEELALEYPQGSATIIVEKVLISHSPKLAVIKAEIERKEVSELLNEYLFFGWAPS